MKGKNSLKIFESSNEVDLSKWNDFINNHKHYTKFQSLEMYEFWTGREKQNGRVFFIESGGGECLAFCSVQLAFNGSFLLRSISKRAIVYGGPLFHEKLSAEERSVIIQLIEKKLHKQATYIELRNLRTMEYCKNEFEKNGWLYIPYMNYIVRLSNEEETFMKFQNEKRRQIRKALREGVSYSYEQSKKNIEETYKILQEVYQKRAKKPLPEISFFEEFLSLKDTGMITVTFEGKVIGGGFYLMDQNSIYDWYRGGLDHDYKHQYPSSVSDWGIMKLAMEKGIPNFDFMGAGIKGVEYGVRDYKSKYRGDLVEFGRFLKINKPAGYYIGSHSLGVFNKIKKIKHQLTDKKD